MTLGIVKRESSLVTELAPRRREVDAWSELIVVHRIADGLVGGVLLALAIVVGCRETSLQVQVVKTLGDIELGSEVVALAVLAIERGVIVAVYDTKVAGGIHPGTVACQRGTEEYLLDRTLVIVVDSAKQNLGCRDDVARLIPGTIASAITV